MGEILDPKRLSYALIVIQNVLVCNGVGENWKKIIFALSVGVIYIGWRACGVYLWFKWPVVYEQLLTNSRNNPEKQVLISSKK